MDLLPSADELSVADAVAELLTRELPLARLHGPTPQSVGARQWSALAESGIFGLGISEEAGGVGFGAVEEALAFREVGRSLAPDSILWTLLAAHVAADAGDTELLERIMGGEERVGLVVPGAGSLTSSGGLSGPIEIMDGHDAGLFVLVTPAASAVYSSTALPERRDVATIDPGVSLAVATAVDLDPLALASGGGTFDRGVMLVAAVLTGISEACRDSSTLHAKTREQFGRPIGVNQAIKHRCADMAVYAAAASAQLLYAAAALEEGDADAGYHASVARVIAQRGAVFTSEANIQIHGGMGYTSEHDAQLFVKRTRALAYLLGSRTSHLAEILAKPEVIA